MLVQYRLALYSIQIDLINAMQACKVVQLFLLATTACLTALVERYSSVDWTVSFSMMWGDSFTICGNSVVYQSAPVVDLCRRLFPVVTQFAPRRRPVRRTPAGFFLNPVLTNRLTQTITQLGSVFRNCSQCLPRRLTDVRVTLSLNSNTTQVTL